jgi:hypothetical protein
MSKSLSGQLFGLSLLSYVRPSIGTCWVKMLFKYKDKTTEINNFFRKHRKALNTKL